MKVKKEFYLPNKGVLSLYNISYLESDFNLVIKNISDSKRKTTLVSKINQNKNVETYEESSYNQELKQNITDFLNDDETV